MHTQIESTNLEKILNTAKKKGADEVEIIHKKWNENPVSFENNKLKSLESNQSSGIAVRLIKNNKIGIASSTNPEAFESIADSAIEASEFGPEAKFHFSSEKINDSDAKLEKTELPLENLVDRGMNVINSLRTVHKDLLVSGGFDLSFGETVYLNSNGVYGKRAKKLFSTSFYGQIIRDNDFLGVYDGNSDLENFPNEVEMCNKIKEKLIESLNITSLETNKYSVYFTPHAVANIFASILSTILNGKAIQQKISPLVNKLGEKLFDKKFTFTENPEIGTAKVKFDDEGIKTQKKVLIKEGIINSFYFDLNTASKINALSTGNGFKAGLASAPSPVLSSLIIEPGNIKCKDMISSMKDGVIVDQVLGAGQSNILAGEFNVGIDLGFKVKNGKIHGRIKNCMIAGNIFDVLSNISVISSEQECLSGSNYFPAILIENMTVAGK